MAHTPAPWKTNIARLSDNSINVAHVIGPQGQGLAQVGTYPDEAETLSNLNLMAAAPDMLAVCKLLADWDRSDGKNDLISDACSAARAAIAKAAA